MIKLNHRILIYLRDRIGETSDFKLKVTAGTKNSEVKLMKLTTILSVAALLYLGSVNADLVIYPAQGQSTEQQQKDEGECFTWAKNQTGIDPLAQDVAAAPSTQQSGGGAVGGAAKGAIVGGIIDGSDGAKTGAAVGLVGGGMRQNRKNRAAAQQNQQNQQQAQTANSENKATFNKAYSVCLQGRGYTVG